MYKKLSTKFHALKIDNHLKWKKHNDQIIPKLCGACYIVRSEFYISNTGTLATVYFANIYSTIKCVIIPGSILACRKKYSLYKRKFKNYSRSKTWKFMQRSF
jgi:hypothetical protein